MSAGLEVADVFRRHGELFCQTHAGHIGRVERRVMGAITACRTAALGGHVEQCDDCGATRIAYNSCRNRHCPKCQGAARERWLAERRGEVLPIPYFHVVFTLPPAAAEIAFQNKAAVYAILFRSAAAALMKLAANPRHLEAELGILAVLHTWGQTLQHHPHIHCVIPGGGPSLDGQRWVSCKPGFFLPVRPLARLFRGMFLAELGAAFEAGDLKFFGDLTRLAAPQAFAQRLADLRGADALGNNPRDPRSDARSLRAHNSSCCGRFSWPARRAAARSRAADEGRALGTSNLLYMYSNACSRK